MGGRNGFAVPGSLGLGAWDDTQALRQWIRNANGTKPPSAQDRAKAIVQAFAQRAGQGVFVHIQRADVASGLLARIEHPDGIAQEGSPLCGPSALTFNLATRDPVGYVHFVIDLYEKGSARIHRLQITPGKDLRNYDPAGQLQPADWIPLASIRDSENWLFDFQAVGDDFAGITLPKHMVSWFERIGFSEVIDDTNVVFTKNQKCIEEAARLYRNDYWICLFVNAQMLDPDKQDLRSVSPDHWIVLTSDVAVTSGNISLTVFSWGDGRRPIPTQASKPLSVAHFLNNFYGYVAARY